MPGRIPRLANANTLLPIVTNKRNTENLGYFVYQVSEVSVLEPLTDSLGWRKVVLQALSQQGAEAMSASLAATSSPSEVLTADLGLAGVIPHTVSNDNLLALPPASVSSSVSYC